MPKESLYFLDMEAALLAGEVETYAVDSVKFSGLHQKFLDMAEIFHQVYSRIYHPDVFAEGGMFTILPPEAQFAEKYILASNCLEQGDEKDFILHVKEAGICHPSMGEACKLLLEKYRDEQEKENREAKEELDALIKILKKRAERLWEDGHEEEAKVIISQILQIQPNPELAQRYHIQ